ncbi:MAG: phenylacetate--CoA ligase family protein [Burkholderiales bacterium]|nr:phenylacetate--CoA ligase family protein [Burkholderiales bacterium]
MTSLYTRLISGAVFPVQERLKKHTTVAVRRGMERSQWWDTDRLEALRNDRLRALLTHAGTFVPYYRQLFTELRFDPKTASLADLSRLPFLTKPLIRANTKALESEQAVGLARFNTGGSSGEPLVFYIGRERVSHDVAAKWRATRWWDVDIGDPEIVVWGSPIELGAQDRMRALRDGLMRTQLLPAFEMSEPKLMAFVAAIRARRPRMLFGYPSALSLIARFAADKKIDLRSLGIRVAFVTAERLYDEQRQQIADAFGCRVANGYGGRDAGFIAHECPEGRLHITAEDIIVEIIGPDGQPVQAGQSGEIVTTHLATKDYPFVRYRTGDIGALGTTRCACGRGLPVLDRVEGRSTDFVVAADGTIMHGLALVYVIRDLTGVASFRIEQESLARTRVQIVPGPGFVDATEHTIVQGLKARLGSAVDVAVERVASIPPERSGKHRYVVSHVRTL